MIPTVSNTDGRPTVAFPLFIVLLGSAMKDWYEDAKRKQADFGENQRKVLIADVAQRVFKPDCWQSLRVGQVIKILRD